MSEEIIKMWCLDLLNVYTHFGELYSPSSWRSWENSSMNWNLLGILIIGCSPCIWTHSLSLRVVGTSVDSVLEMGSLLDSSTGVVESGFRKLYWHFISPFTPPGGSRWQSLRSNPRNRSHLSHQSLPFWYHLSGQETNIFLRSMWFRYMCKAIRPVG